MVALKGFVPQTQGLAVLAGFCCLLPSFLRASILTCHDVRGNVTLQAITQQPLPSIQCTYMSDHTCSFFTCSAASTLAAAGAGGPSSSELPSKLPMIGSSLRRLFSSLNDMIMSTTGSAVQRLDLLAMLRYESDVMNLVCKSALINTISLQLPMS